MWTPVKLNNGETYPYGFGWQLEPAGTHRQVRHGGSLPGFRAEYTRLIDDKLSVIVLTNGDGANAASIAAGIADRYIPDVLPNRTVAKVDPKIFDAFVGHYLPNPSNPTFIIIVTREGKKLMVQEGPDAEKEELLPESETDFFIGDDPLLTYTFVKDDNGLVTALAVNRGKQQLGRAKKIK